MRTCTAHRVPTPAGESARDVAQPDTIRRQVVPPSHESSTYGPVRARRSRRPASRTSARSGTAPRARVLGRRAAHRQPDLHQRQHLVVALRGGRGEAPHRVHLVERCQNTLVRASCHVDGVPLPLRVGRQEVQLQRVVALREHRAVGGDRAVVLAVEQQRPGCPSESTSGRSDREERVALAVGSAPQPNASRRAATDPPSTGPPNQCPRYGRGRPDRRRRGRACAYAPPCAVSTVRSRSQFGPGQT